MFREMFGSFSSELNRTCLSGDQIDQFVRDHRQWLRSDCETFFLKRAGAKFVVLSVRLGVVTVELDLLDPYVWRAKGHYRLVVARL